MVHIVLCIVWWRFVGRKYWISFHCNNNNYTNRLLLPFTGIKIMWSAKRVSLNTNHNTRTSLLQTYTHMWPPRSDVRSRWGIFDRGNSDYSSPLLRAWVLRVSDERKGKDVLDSVLVSFSSSKHNKIIRALVSSWYA